MFSGSLKEPRDAKFTTRATFWNAETNYVLANYGEALIGFKQFQQQANASSTPENKNITYNLAYTYFKQKNYPQAISNYKQFISSQQTDDIRLNDAYLRLGDAHFVSSQYAEAIQAYDAAIKINKVDSDYAFFQKSISYGYEGKASKKIEELENFLQKYPKSTLRDDAMFELGNSYVKANDDVKGLKMYSKLQTDYRMSTFIPRAMLRQGLIHYNKSDNEQALNTFKAIAKDYPGTAEANQAVSTARLIYIDLVRVYDYAIWVRTLDYVEVTDADLDNTTYESAEKKYIDNKTDDAIKQFNSYLRQFPKGLHALQAHFYVAKLYDNKGLKENAIPHYQYVADASPSEFTEESLFKVSQIYLENKQWMEAIPVLKRLEQEASFPQNVIFAQSNLMKAHYQLNKYVEAVAYAENVINQGVIDVRIYSVSIF